MEADRSEGGGDFLPGTIHPTERDERFPIEIGRLDNSLTGQPVTPRAVEYGVKREQDDTARSQR